MQTRAAGETVVDHFDSGQIQPSDLCTQRAHRRRDWPRLAPPGLSAGPLVAMVAVTAVVFALALGLVSAGRHPVSLPAGGHQAPPVATQQPPFRGIPQRGRTLGDARAPVTITYFADLECPLCRRFSLSGTFRRLVNAEVRPGRVKLYFRSLCTATCDNPPYRRSRSLFAVQQAAAYAAGSQDRLWDYALLFYRHQGSEGTRYVTPTFLKRLASHVSGLNVRRWEADRKNPRTLALVGVDARYARTHHLDATPTLILQGARGVVTLVGVPTSYRQLADDIARVQGRGPKAST